MSELVPVLAIMIAVRHVQAAGVGLLGLAIIDIIQP
jgi:hypothetical protein